MRALHEAHIPLDDPVAIEAVGRNKGEGMWGREDNCRYGDDDDAGWFAFTTDPVRHDLAATWPGASTPSLPFSRARVSPPRMRWANCLGRTTLPGLCPEPHSNERSGGAPTRCHV